MVLIMMTDAFLLHSDPNDRLSPGSRRPFRSSGTRSRYAVTLVVAFVSPWAHLHVMGMLRFMSVTKQMSLPAPFKKKSVPVYISDFTALSTTFHFTNSPDNSPFSHSVLTVLSLPYWSFKLDISMKVSLQP